MNIRNGRVHGIVATGLQAAVMKQAMAKGLPLGVFALAKAEGITLDEAMTAINSKEYAGISAALARLNRTLRSQ